MMLAAKDFVKILLIIIGLIYQYRSAAQDATKFKYEKESRIKTASVPTPAVDFISSLPFKKKIKWYKEQGLTGISYEAKTKYKNRKYSIEFSEDGTFEDVEINMREPELQYIVYEGIELTLKSQFKEFGIMKIQEQFSGDIIEVKKLWDKESSQDKITKRYELIVKGKTKRTFELFEFLFSDTGNLLSQKKLITKINDNLEF